MNVFVYKLIINKNVFFAGNSNIPRILTIFAEAFFRDAMDPTSPNSQRILNIIKQVQANATLFQNVVSTLRPELQQALHIALNKPC